MKRSEPPSHAHIPAKLKYKRRKIEEFQSQQTTVREEQSSLSTQSNAAEAEATVPAAADIKSPEAEQSTSPKMASNTIPTENDAAAAENNNVAEESSQPATAAEAETSKEATTFTSENISPPPPTTTTSSSSPSPDMTQQENTAPLSKPSLPHSHLTPPDTTQEKEDRMVDDDEPNQQQEETTVAPTTTSSNEEKPSTPHVSSSSSSGMHNGSSAAKTGKANGSTTAVVPVPISSSPPDACNLLFEDTFLSQTNGYAYFSLDPSGSHISVPDNVTLDVLLLSTEWIHTPVMMNASSPQPSAASLYFFLTRFENCFYFMISNHYTLLSIYKFNLNDAKLQQLNIISMMLEEEEQQRQILRLLHLISSGKHTPSAQQQQQNPSISAPDQTAHPSHVIRSRRFFVPSSLSYMLHPHSNPLHLDQLTTGSTLALERNILHQFHLEEKQASLVTQCVVKSFTQFNQERLFSKQFKDSIQKQTAPSKLPSQSPFLTADIFVPLNTLFTSQKHALLLQYIQQPVHNNKQPIFSLRSLNQAYTDIIKQYQGSIAQEGEQSSTDAAWQQIQNLLKCQIQFCQQLRGFGDLFNSLLTLYYLTLFFVYGKSWMHPNDLQREKQLSQSLSEFLAGYTFSIISLLSPEMRIWWSLAMQELENVPDSLVDTKSARCAVSHGWDHSTLQKVMNGKRSSFAKWKKMEPLSCGYMRIDMLIHQKSFKQAYYVASCVGEQIRWLQLMLNRSRAHSATIVTLQCEKDPHVLTSFAQNLHQNHFLPSFFVACRALQRISKQYSELLNPEVSKQKKKKQKKSKSSSSSSTNNSNSATSSSKSHNPSAKEIENVGQQVCNISKWIFENYLKPLPVSNRSVLRSPFVNPVAQYLYPARYEITDKELRPKLSEMYEKYRAHKEILYPLVVGFLLKYTPCKFLVDIALSCLTCGRKHDAFDLFLWIYHTEGYHLSEKITDRLLNLATEFNRITDLLQPTHTVIQSPLYPDHNFRQPTVHHLPSDAPIPFKWTKILYTNDIHLAHTLGIISLHHRNTQNHEELDLPWFFQSVCLSLSQQHILDLLFKIESMQIQLHPRVIARCAQYIKDKMSAQQSVHFLANCIQNHNKMMHTRYGEDSEEVRNDSVLPDLIFHLLEIASQVSVDSLIHTSNEFLPLMSKLYEVDTNGTVFPAYDGAVLRIVQYLMQENRHDQALIVAHNWTLRQEQDLEGIKKSKCFYSNRKKLGICKAIFQLSDLVTASKLGDLDLDLMKKSAHQKARVIHAKEFPTVRMVKKIKEEEILTENEYAEYLNFICERPFLSNDVRQNVVKILLLENKVKEALRYEEHLQLPQKRLVEKEGSGTDRYNALAMCTLTKETLSIASQPAGSSGDTPLASEIWKRYLSLISNIDWTPSYGANDVDIASMLDILRSVFKTNQVYIGVCGKFPLNKLESLLHNLQIVRGSNIQILCSNAEKTRSFATTIAELKEEYKECFPHITKPTVFNIHFSEWKEQNKITQEAPAISEAVKTALAAA